MRSSIQIHQATVLTLAALRDFLDLERSFLAGTVGDVAADPQQLIHLSTERMRRPNWKTAYFIAVQDDRPVARCTAHCQLHRIGQPTNGYIGNLAARPEAARAAIKMMTLAELWLRDRGAHHVLASHDGSPMSWRTAIRMAAFDEDPFPMSWNPPYYREYLLAAGYRPRNPLWMYDIDLATARRDGHHHRGPPLEIRTIDPRRWDEDLQTLRGLFNASLRQQVSLAEFREPFDAVRQHLEPRLIQLGYHEGHPVGFVVGVEHPKGPTPAQPDPRLHPQVRPPGTLDESPTAAAVAGGLLPQFQGLGLGALVLHFYSELEQMGHKTARYGPVSARNLASRRLAESIGGNGRVLYQCFAKPLGA